MPGGAAAMHGFFGIKPLLTTLGAYRLLAYNDKQDFSHALAPFLHRKQAVCPKSGHEALNRWNNERIRAALRMSPVAFRNVFLKSWVFDN